MEIPDKFMVDGKNGKVQGKWIASKILAVRGRLGIGAGWTPVAQKALDYICEDENMKAP